MSASRAVPSVARPGAGAALLTLTVDGPPRTKKTSNRIAYRAKQGGGTRPIILPSEASGEYAVRVHQAFAAMPVRERRACPITDSVEVRALFYVDKKGEPGDLHGYEQSLADALEACGALLDDWLVRSWDGTRVVMGDPHPRTELVITELGA